MLKIQKHWEDVNSFEAEVIDPRGEVFYHNGEPWLMVLRATHSDEIQKVLKKNRDEEESWRARQPKTQRDGPLPQKMAERHGIQLCAASHVKWINAPYDDESVEVDFDSEDFVEFLKAEPWYIGQWQKAWFDVKNSKRLLEEGKPNKSSSTGPKPK